MKHSHKRIISIAMAAAMSFCAIPLNSPLSFRPALVASAETISEEDFGFTVNEADAYVTITGYTGTDDEVTIPSEIEGLPVTNIESWAFFQKKDIKKIILPDSIKTIGNSAFNSCTSLESVRLSKELTTIGDSAFADCSALTDIVIPDKVTAIGSRTFGSCKALKNITIPASVTSIGENAFENTVWLETQRNADPFVVVNHILIDGRKLSGVITIPDDVTSICDQAFYGCTDLTGIIIPSNVESIGGSAFCDCTGLSSVSIASGVKSIGYQAFGRCTGLTKITIPDSVTKIEGSTFFGCENLTSVTLPEGLTTISNSMFSSCKSMTDINIPDSVTSIEAYAFMNCSSLKDLIIPEGVENIAYAAFILCSGMETITIPDSVKTIGPSAFSNCPNITIIGNAGTTAETYASQYGISFQLKEQPGNAKFTDASLTLADTLGLNFFTDATAADYSQYSVKFSGKCVEDGVSVPLTEKNGKYCATAHIYSNNMDETITATLYKGDERIGVPYKYSVNKYLADALEENPNAKTRKMINATKNLGLAADNYFNGGNNSISLPDVDASAYEPDFKGTSMLSLVLNSETSIRLYIKGLGYGVSDDKGIYTSKKGGKGTGDYANYFEITGLKPRDLAKEYHIYMNNKEYSFSALSWCCRVLKSGSGANDQNKNLAKAVVMYYQAADEYVK